MLRSHLNGLKAATHRIGTGRGRNFASQALLLVLLCLGTGLGAQPSQLPQVNDALQTIRRRTSRVVVTVKGRDQSRQLTTYPLFKNQPDSELIFGFPPSSLRHHDTERMELFDGGPLKNDEDHRSKIRRVTLRHPWHDVYMTSEVMHVRSCYYGLFLSAGSGKNQCSAAPYFYLEETYSDGDTRHYKIRFFSKQRNARNEPNAPQVVNYVYVSEHHWKMRLRAQMGLITHALAVASKRVWRESLNLLFEKLVKRYPPSKGKNASSQCSQHPALRRDRLYNQVSLEDFVKDIRSDMRSRVPCQRLNLPTAKPATRLNNAKLASRVPWKEMTADQKKALVCSVGHVVCVRLRKALVELARRPCFRRKRWGLISKGRRFELLIDKHLTAGWLQRRQKADQWLVALVDGYIDSKTTTFVFREGV